MMSTRALPSVGQLAVQLLIGVDQQENIRADSHRADSLLDEFPGSRCIAGEDHAHFAVVPAGLQDAFDGMSHDRGIQLKRTA